MGGHGASNAAHLRNFSRKGDKGFLKYKVAPAFDDEQPPHKFPMYVLPIDRAIEVTARDQELPCHEDLRAEGYLVEYEPSTMNSCLFFSHTWLRHAHPDNAHGVKRRLMHGLLTGIKAGTVGFSAYWFAVVSHHMKDIAPKAVTDAFSEGFVWLDYWAIPQRDSSSQALAIQSIPHYVANTHAFIVLAGPWIHEDSSVRDLLAWNSRGWCRMEQVANALSPVNKPVICATSVSSVKNFGPAEVCSRFWFSEVVGKGNFTVEADKFALRPVINGLIERRVALALRQNDMIWYRTLKALTSTILMGTESADDVAGAASSTRRSSAHEAPADDSVTASRTALGMWLYEMKFKSPTDGDRDTGHSPLRYAVIEGRVDLVRALLTDFKVDVEAPIHPKHVELMFHMMPGSTILHQACMSQHGHRAGLIVNLLLKAKADPRRRASAQNWTPLHLAMSTACTDAIAALMAHDRTLCDERLFAGINCFERCAVGGKVETMRWLIETYPDVIKPQLSKVTLTGATWAHLAVFEENSAEMLTVLLEHGANPNIDTGKWIPEGMEKSPLLRFLVPFLMSTSLRVKAQPPGLMDHMGNCLKSTALHVAAFTGNLRSLEVLLKADAAIAGPRTQIHMLKCTPVHCAAMGGHDAVAERLLVANPELVKVKDRKGRLPSWWARRRGHAALATRLAQLEASPSGSQAPSAGEHKQAWAEE